MVHLTNSEPLAAYNLFRTRSLDEARERVGNVFCPHRLTITRETRRFNAVQNHVDTGLLSLSYIDYGADVEIEPGALESFYLIQIPTAGAASIRTGPQTVAAHAGQASILNPAHYTSMKWHAGCRKIQVQVAKSVLDDFAADYFGRDFDASIVFDPAMDLSRPDTGAWVRHVAAFIRLIERSGISADNAHRRRYYSEEILRGLVEAQPNTHAHFSPASMGGPVPGYVRSAIDYIRAHADEPISSADIARTVGVAGRTLQYGFRHHLGRSPMQALREERLNRCRLDLVLGDADISVSGTARRWGFSHLGRFSRYYRSQFNETPGETARRRRRTTPHR